MERTGLGETLEQQYNIISFEECCNRHGEAHYWKTFLIVTDYIANKIIEANYLGEPLDEDYTEVLEARKLCRQKINELQNS